MSRTNPLIQFHEGVTFHDLQVTVPWHITHECFLDLIPRDMITSANSNWICCDCTLFGVTDSYAFNFIAHPDPLFHEIQVYDQDPTTMTPRFRLFVDAVKNNLGEPTMEFEKHVRWHDKSIVLDLSITDVRSEPDGPKFPRFMLSLQNSTKYARHWNNQPRRRPGLEQWG